MATFIIDCPECKAKLGAAQEGMVEDTGFIDEIGEPYGERIYVGKCPKWLVARRTSTANSF
jgi:hypothetical protein